MAALVLNRTCHTQSCPGQIIFINCYFYLNLQMKRILRDKEKLDQMLAGLLPIRRHGTPIKCVLFKIGKLVSLSISR